jgi:hypothetical protein
MPAREVIRFYFRMQATYGAHFPVNLESSYLFEHSPPRA